MEENELVELTLPGSPGDPPWEGCLNSVNCRVPRGVAVSVPKGLAEHIMNTEAARSAAEKTAQRLACG